MLVAASLCALHVVLRPAAVDFASGDLRSRLFGAGSYLWSNNWFGGHSLPSYGLIPPMLGSWLGVEVVGIVSVLAATWCLTRVTERCVELRPTLADPLFATVLFAIGCALNLWAGRLTFGPSVAFGAGCLLALQHRRVAVAALCALGCGLSSPIGALSLAMVLAGCWCARSFSRRALVAIAAVAVIPVALLAVAFPEGGWYPFTGGGFVLLVSGLALVAWLGRRERVVVWTVAVYAVAAVGAFVLRTPLGGNIARLGWLAIGPVAVLNMRRLPRAGALLIAAASIMWGWSYAKAAFLPTDATADPAFYNELADFVNAQPGGIQRVEVVPTATFRQADELSFKISLARGWDTQLDRKYNPQMYDRELTHAEFREWLRDNGVGLVALPLGQLQAVARAEADLITSHPDYLEQVWRSDQWEVYRVVGSHPLASGGAEIRQVTPDSLVVNVPHTGSTTILFRYTKLYEVTAGDACVSEAAGGWIALQVYKPGLVTLTAKLSINALLPTEATCPS